jgi:hypothetical protein
MDQSLDNLANNYIHEYGRDSIAAAFQQAAKCLENQDYAGYERHFRIYVRLAQRSGFARELSRCHRDVSAYGHDTQVAL